MMIRAAIVCIPLFASSPTRAAACEIKVTLLGTGCPTPAIDRFGPSTLVETAGQKFIFDAGRGAIQRLRQINVRWQDIDGVFITHLHSDHVVGFPDLWLTGWLAGAGRNRPLPVWGPSGTKGMISHLEQAFEFDIHNRIENNHSKPEGAAVIARDITEGIVFEERGVRVTAFEVDHGPVKPALGYRIDAGGRSVVLSGDTRYSENLINHATGVDLLIHEVVAPESLRRAGVPSERLQSVVDYHTTPEQAGKVFARVRPKLAVYSHIVMSPVTEEDLVAPTRTSYSGPLEVGADLMVIEVGEQIVVHRADRGSP